MSRSFAVAVSFNLISMVTSGFALVVSTFISTLLIKALIANIDVVILLATNTYLALLAFSLTLFIDNIQMFRGDYGFFLGEETVACRMQGYLLYVFLSSVMNAFALQGVFRLCRVVYARKIWLQNRLTYLCAISVLWIFSFLLILPIHFWFDIQLMPEENVCLATTRSARGLIWCSIGVYTLPMSIINSVYLKMSQYLRRTPVIGSVRTKRDILVIRRIVLVLGVLLTIGTPTIILMLTFPFTKVAEPLFYRISSMTMGLSVGVLSITLIYTSPQLKQIIKHPTKNRNQIIPLTLRNRTERVATLTGNLKTAKAGQNE